MEVFIMVVDKDKNTQVLVTISFGLLKKVEQYWHNKKLKNRTEAIRQLIIKGLQAEGEDTAGN
jgi:metal-responsive CopG/Arc/MetJ family transcriptional regulator